MGNYECGSMPELMACWYLGAMLSQEKYFPYFLDTLQQHNPKEQSKIEIEKIEVIREYKIEYRRIDILVKATTSQNRGIVLVIEGKVHWPDENQLQNSIKKIERKEEFKTWKVIGINFITTLTEGQLKALKEHEFDFDIVTIQDVISSYCKYGIAEMQDINLASSLLDACIITLKNDDSHSAEIISSI